MREVPAFIVANYRNIVNNGGDMISHHSETLQHVVFMKLCRLKCNFSGACYYYYLLICGILMTPLVYKII
jgi:hypothetical protein